MSSPARQKSRRLLIFDDGRGNWGPLTDLRAVFSLRTGAQSNRARIESNLGVKAADLRVVPGLVGDYGQREKGVRVNENLHSGDQSAKKDGEGATVLLVNGRWSGGPPLDPRRITQLTAGEVLLQEDGQLIAAKLGMDEAQRLIDSGFGEVRGAAKRSVVSGRVLIDRPWHIQDDLDRLLLHDLENTRVPRVKPQRIKGSVQFGKHPLRIDRSAVIQPTAVFNTEQGPIVVDKKALIGAQTVLEGPCYIGAGSQITCHTHIRPNTVIGEMCKVGGEISHSIIQGYTNKAHRGYLGNSIVGQWVNLGAETNVSNLKNTYGIVQVQLERDLGRESTGRQYMGPIIGDFVRTAIGTRLPTGAVVGTGAMIALSAFAPKLVRRFAFLTDQTPGEDSRQDLPRFLETANRMMTRRGQALTRAERVRLDELYRR